VRVREALTIHAAPDRVAALYRDYASWPRVFPATIRGVRLLGAQAGETRVEVDHRTEGHVLNVIRQQTPTIITLEESKPRYDATFVNRFDPSPEGTRYTVDAVIRFRMPYALLAPLLRGMVRRRIHRFVLEPVRAAAEASASGTTI
jgi:hypothetical protein